MKEYQLTKLDLISALQEQMYFLDRSLSFFLSNGKNKGYFNKVIGDGLDLTDITSEIEAKRIATTIRTLVHDTKNSQSLLEQLEIKKNIKFVDSAEPNDGRLHSMTGMHGVIGSKTDDYFGLVAKINNGDSLISAPLFLQHLKKWYSSYKVEKFEEWWTMDVYCSGTNSYSRKDLVLLLANKDGGAHIDSKHPENYRKIKTKGLTLNINGVVIKLDKDVALASVAQIGWELLNSINKEDLGI